MDSAETHHVTKTRNDLQNVPVVETNLNPADKNFTPVAHVGDKALQKTPCQLDQAMCPPEIDEEIISVSNLAQLYSVTFEGSNAYIADLIEEKPQGIVRLKSSRMAAIT